MGAGMSVHTIGVPAVRKFGGEMKVSRVVALAVIIAAAALSAAAAGAQVAPGAQTTPDGAALFHEHCSTCHVSGGMKGSAAPSVEVLGQKTRQEILRALESGAMTIYGNRMIEVERLAVAAYLSSKTADDAEQVQANLCSTRPASMAHATVLDRWDGWGNGPENTRDQRFTQVGTESVS